MIINLVAWAVIGLGFLALWHAIYELILLPTIRQSVRFKIFALRDRLRAFKADNARQCSDETFHMLDTQLSWAMDNLPRLTYSMLHQSDRLLRRNEELRNEVARRKGILNACKLNEYVAIRQQSTELVLKTLALNSGGWIVYLFPIAYPHLWFVKIKKQAQRLTLFPASEFDHLQACPA